MSQRDLAAEQAQWQALSGADQFWLRLLALQGAPVMALDLVRIWERLPRNVVGPNRPPSGAHLLRQAGQLTPWVERRGDWLAASETLRRVSLRRGPTIQLAAALLEVAVAEGKSRFYGFMPRADYAVCWLLCGASGGTAPVGSMLIDAMRWLLVPGHDQALFAAWPSAVRREWLTRRYYRAIDMADADLPHWRAQLDTLAAEDRAQIERAWISFDDRLLCGSYVPEEASEHPRELMFRATARCLQQADLGWLADLETAVKAYRRDSDTDRLLCLPGLLHWLLLLADQSKASIRRLRSLSRINPNKLNESEYHRQARLAQIASAWLDGSKVELQRSGAGDPLGWWLELVLAWWRDVPIDAKALAIAEQAAEHARLIGWVVLADELRATIGRCRGEPEGQTLRIVDLRTRQAAWERTLATLEALAQQGQAQGTSRRVGRLLLRLRPVRHLEHHFKLELLQSSLLASGRESKPKLLRTAKAVNAALASWPAESQQAAILRAASLDIGRHRYEGPEYAMGMPDSQTLKAALDYPDVVDGAERPLRLREGRPKLTLAGDGKGALQLSLQAPFEAGIPVSWVPEGQTWWRFEPNDQQRLLHGLLAQPQRLPANALQRLTQVAQSLQPWAELALEEGAGATRVPSHPLPHLLLEWNEGGLLLQPRVRPLGADDGPYLVPGQGPAQLLGSVGGLPAMTDRDLAAERTQAAALLTELQLADEILEDAEPALPLDTEAALDFLARVEALDSKPILAWPKGGARKVLRAGPLQLQLNSGRDWIGVDGGLSLPDGSTLALNRLIGLIRDGESRFLRLDEQRLLQLDSKLRAQLQRLNPLADSHGKLKLHQLAAPALAQALGDDELAQAGALQKLLGKRAAAFALQSDTPATLQAELRDYQREGFQWLQRMAAWGAGACLADDMGLGKTVQSLALLCARASDGPALIVAPTSVLGNWAAEARRFAPDLRVQRYEQSEDRPRLIAALGRGDLLLVSYTLLALDAEALASRPFATVVLDEAQAIKNPATQRARAACLLDAGFRVALTGTPIENHLGELWSLMRFLNPGLLGSEQAFAERYQRPIETRSAAAAAARTSLRQLMSGFVLRRTKAQVLEELPERTEITLRIEPSEEEAKLQQAMRMQALERLEANREAPVGARRFSILAELMRLRRGACHPQLYAPELKLASAKLEQLVELLAELRDNHHRALVFSQFVDYLTLVRQALEAKGISYQYLDGSTPSRQREQIVAAFQQGQGDCFLLSLKAGGSGLNLTAADYVIHLDPWWNPAVEQQASDRAHRIGQTRPVTVYRLVLADSIEERILSLHGAKRELMDSVLAEADGGGALSEEDLLALLNPAT